MGVGDKLTAAHCNFVHLDQIWKDHVHKETAVTKKWGGTWRFLRDEYQSLNRDLTTMREKPGSQGSTGKEKPPLKLPPLKAPKQDTSNPFPVVTSREVGWRSGRPDCQLEVYGRWGRPKYTIYKQLQWPGDAVP